MSIRQLINKLTANTYDGSQLRGLLINYSKYTKDSRIKQTVKDEYLEKIAIIERYMEKQGM